MKEQNSIVHFFEWVGVFFGPVAWWLQFQINYALVQRACIDHNLLPLHVVSGIFLLLTVVAGVLCALHFRKTHNTASPESLSARSHFMAGLGFTMNALFALLILAQAIAAFIYNPCEK